MPRRPRSYLPEVPAHVVQRGNNRTRCFLDDDDFQFYLLWLREALMRYSVDLNAYVLMSNHVHLLVTPRDDTGISNVMQHQGRMYVAYFNQKYDRTGTLWEGRHRASLVQTETYLMNVYRYIELNPVRAFLSKTPCGYAWSSYHANALNERDSIVTPHPLYRSLGTTDHDRAKNYSELFGEGLTQDKVNTIRSSTIANFPLGDDAFIDDLKRKGLTIGWPGRGRPSRLVRK